ncbi:DHH family phosphoesterase [Thermospira aquatica]|uniref:Bifunctional oligoribonuclease/PAP phosphatase NrnA n=1 Tax=Thermospira aquatica TaxID=2828656 RepID=A0AAX3BDP7_9SPIR|nr:bifunctional oligoribonuclease/PAP phosphatase NrnA [Thermospira aquatica]URA10350.1 bifunctional oligoribonuclease/PAP phosphatase NrnA [Thermospira aquatica]
MRMKNNKFPLSLRWKLNRIIHKFQRFMVLTHVRPDGDAIGSILALTLYLKKHRKEVWTVLEDNLEEKYRFLSCAQNTYVYDEKISAPLVDVVFILDSGDISRIGKVQNWLSSSLIINIDHHKDNTHFGDINWVDPAASCVGEMLFRWFGKEAKGEMTQALFLSLATDTGFFRFSNASPEVYRMAAFLLEKGASQTAIYETLYQNRPFQFLRLVEKLLSHLELHNEGKLAISYITEEDMRLAECHDTEGLLEYLAMIKGVEIFILIKEREKEQISISFRTKTNYDVSILAKEFGGGGHTKAAGCSVTGDPLQWKQTILESTTRFMERYSN